MFDKEIDSLIKLEEERQNEGIELIASENYPSKEIREACGSICIAKYAEGYPGKRYYGGCEYIDQIEQLAIDRACELFGCKYANVQPHSGSQANAAAYRALEKTLQEEGKLTRGKGFRKMKILSTNLDFGGHLTHGSAVSFSSNLYDFGFFDMNDEGKIDFNLVEEKIKEFKPDVILAGYSAYPYEVDFKEFKRLAVKYNCKLVVDMAHIAGLVATGEHMSPIPYADIVTTTTHKTLRGPRGGLILTNDEKLIKKINSAIFPYYQGGPLENIIAGKAICFKEALDKSFKEYIKLVKLNTKTFADYLISKNIKCTHTDNHLVLVNTKESFNMTGLEAQNKLGEIGITVNKNMIPFDTESPARTSGLRIGFAALTTRGCVPVDAILIADVIIGYLNGSMDINKAKKELNKTISHLKKMSQI